MRIPQGNTEGAGKNRLRPLIAVGATAVAALTLTGTWKAGAAPGGSHSPSASPAKAQTGLLWAADPARGTDDFEGVETEPGEVNVVDDPEGKHGKTYRLHTSGKKSDPSEHVRVETRGHKTRDGKPLRFTEGDTVYVGWRSMWNPLPTAEKKWVILWQLKDYGSGAAAPPLSLCARGDGTLDLEHSNAGLKTTELWGTELDTERWYDFVVGITISKDPSKGKVDFWVDGKRQHLKGGDTFKGATLRADWVTDKWGIYRDDAVKGPATAYLNSPKVGKSYKDVAP